jgi:hypothetical protein
MLMNQCSSLLVSVDPAGISILSKGLNFSYATTSASNMREVISGVERAFEHLLPLETAEGIQQETCCILRQSKAQKNSTSTAST